VFAGEIVKKTLARFGQINALVNVAGDAPQGHILQLTDEDWEQAFSLKHFAAQRLTRAVWPELKKRRGSVIFTSGVTAHTPLASLGTIGSVNSAIVAAAKAWAEQGSVDGVRVNTVLPGAVKTQRRMNIIQRDAETYGISVVEAEQKHALSKKISRLGNPSDIGNVVSFLLSPAAEWIHGSAIDVDGGETRGV
jgi:3-oxoacyl-[acyl-carrier protein] reductase